MTCLIFFSKQRIMHSATELLVYWCVMARCCLLSPLQKPTNDTGYAFPGGHVEFGETNEDTLIREFKEEIGADIKVKEIKWVAEIFFPWGDKPCHQICLYYIIELADETQIPLDGKFIAHECIEGRDFDIEFHWIPLAKVKNVEVYPSNASELLEHIDEGVKHFVYKEN